MESPLEDPSIALDIPLIAGTPGQLPAYDPDGSGRLEADPLVRRPSPFCQPHAPPILHGAIGHERLLSRMPASERKRASSPKGIQGAARGFAGGRRRPREMPAGWQPAACWHSGAPTAPIVPASAGSDPPVLVAA